LLFGLIGNDPPAEVDSPDWPPYVHTLIPNVPAPKTPEQVEPTFTNTGSELRQLLARFGTPPRPTTYSSDVALGVKPSEGLKIVEQILHSSLADDFVGRFDNNFIVPGGIIDCMPYVRADLDSPVHALTGLNRHEYKVALYTFVRDDPNSTGKERNVWTIRPGLQKPQSQQFHNEIYSSLGTQSDQLRSPTRFRRSARFARSYSEAQAKLGFTLSNPFVNVSYDRSRESRSDRRVFLGMVQQEFFRLGAAPVPQDGQSGPDVWMSSDDGNIRALKDLIPTGNALPGIPAIISEVRYGRVIIVAFETEWNEAQDEMDLHIDGNYQGTSASVDAWKKAFDSSASGTIDIIVYGGGDLPVLPGGVEVEKGNDSNEEKKLRINKEVAVETIDKILADGMHWSSEQPGLPISVVFELLDDGGTVLKPINTSLVEMARAASPSGGWIINLHLDVKNDYDDDSFFTGTDSGDWKFWLKAHEKEIDYFDQDVTADASFDRVGKLDIPAHWGQRVGGFSIKIVEDDGGLRWGADGSEFEFNDELKLEKPAAYRDFEDHVRATQIELARLTSTFQKALRLEGASDKDDSLQKTTHGEWVKTIQRLQAELEPMGEKVNTLRNLRDEALAAMNAIRDGGVPGIVEHDAGNTYTITGKPNLTGYMNHVSNTTAAIERSFNNIKAYADAR